MLSKMKHAFKQWAIWAILGAGTAFATIDFPKEDRRSPVQQFVANEKMADFAGRLGRAPLSAEVRGQPFAAHDWAPVRRALPSPAAEPVLPQFPFRFAGRLKERGGAESLYLARGSDIFPIRVGELLEGFRIDALHGDRLDVTFVAGGQRLSMLLSSLTGAGDGAAAASGPSDSGTLLSAQSAVAERPGSGAAAAAIPSEVQAATPAGSMRRASISPASTSSSGRSSSQTATPGETPTYGSMPTDSAPLRSPQLGVGPGSSERLGTEPASSRKLGL
jgi:hypothetical protein